MRITDIEIHKASRRPTETGSQEISIVIGNGRRAQSRALNGCLVIGEPEPKSKILCRVPLQSNSVSQRVFVTEANHTRGTRRILQNDRDTLQAVPSGPGNIAHDGELTLKTLIEAEMINLWQIQLCGRVLVEEDILERIGLRELNRRAGSCYGRHIAKADISFQGMTDP